MYSYKQLCELTGAEYKTGKARQLAFESLGENSFARFMNVEKISRGKYQIKEIYDNASEVINKRTLGNSNVYVKYIELILAKYLSVGYGNEAVIFSRRKLWLLLGMVNEKYRRIQDSTLLKRDTNLTKHDIDSFYMRCNSKLNRILNTALKNMSNKKLIDFEERTVICKFKNGKYNHVLATPEERDVLLKIEGDVLNEFECSSISEVIFKKKSDKYYDRVIEIIEERYGWIYYYKAYSIVFNHDRIVMFMPQIERSFDDAVAELNDKVVSALNKEAVAIFNREVKKYYEILEESFQRPEVLRKFTYFERPSDDYIPSQEFLANELVRLIANKGEKPDDLDVETGIDGDNSFCEEELLLMEKYNEG